MEKPFWSQYAGAEHPVPLSDQLKQLVELHRAVEVVRKDFVVGSNPRKDLFTLGGGKGGKHSRTKLSNKPKYHIH